jgi:hypothetical protein
MSAKDIEKFAFQNRTAEEQQKIAVAGGKASGESRRQKRAWKDLAEFFGSLPVQGKNGKVAIDPRTGEEMDHDYATIAHLSEMALSKDPRVAIPAINALIRIRGTELTVTHKGDANAPLRVDHKLPDLTPEQVLEIARMSHD